VIKYMASLGLRMIAKTEAFPWNYSKSRFELYEDVVRFQYRSVKLNAKTIVHFSQLV
jgi:hypothetical protein